MEIYNPDVWVVIYVKDTKKYKLLAGWYGDFWSASTWRLNSGIEEIKDNKDFYEVYGKSGSLYRVRKGTYKFNDETREVYERADNMGMVELLHPDNDWTNLLSKKHLTI